MPFILDNEKSKKDKLVFKNQDNEIAEIDIVFTKNIKSSIKLSKERIILRAGNYLNSAHLINFATMHVERFYQAQQAALQNMVVKVDESKFVLFGQEVKFYWANKKLFFTYIFDGEKKSVVKTVLNQDLVEESLFKNIKKIFVSYLVERQQHWEAIMGIVPHEISIRDKTTSWASNYVKKRKIIYAIKACAFDKDDLDYLIVHELSHNIFPNHSKGFWNHVQQYIPNYKQSVNNFKSKKYFKNNEEDFI